MQAEELTEEVKVNSTEEVDSSTNFEQIECEKVEDLYWSGELIKSEVQLYRLVTAKGRVYFRFQDQKNYRNPILYFGATSVSDEMPTSKHLIDWKVSKAVSDGADTTERYVWIRTLYGSLSHTILADFINSGEVNLRELPKRLREYFYSHSLYCTEEELKSLGTELQKDFIAIKRFIQDHDVKFVGVEVPVWSDMEGMATQIDLICFMNWRESAKKDWQRVFAIIDYKTTKKSVARPEMRMQLESCKNMLIENYPQLAENRIMLFNLSPNNWRTTNWNYKTKPYKLTLQDDKVDDRRYPHYLELAKMTAQEKWSRNVTFIDGNMKLTDDPSQFIKSKTIYQIIEEGLWQGLFANQKVEEVEAR